MAPVNWPGLLAWSTKYHDGTAPSEFRQMSDEDRKFLEAAMKEAFGQIEDPNEVMLEAIKEIKADTRTDESITTALEIIDRCCDEPDCARNAEKLDGVQPLLDLLGTHNSVLQARTLEILALFFSNNPNMQAVGVRRGAMKVFLGLMKSSPPQSDVRPKAFRALVALVRQVDEYEETFLGTEDGVQVLLGCLGPEEAARTHEKAASFVGALATAGRLKGPDVRSLAQALAQLFPGAGSESIQYRETLASSAFELAHASPAECPPELDQAVRTRLAQVQADKSEDTEVEASTLQDCTSAFAAGAGGTPAL